MTKYMFEHFNQIIDVQGVCSGYFELDEFISLSFSQIKNK